MFETYVAMAQLWVGVLPWILPAVVTTLWMQVAYRTKMALIIVPSAFIHILALVLAVPFVTLIIILVLLLPFVLIGAVLP